jgi:hypothetical protein
MPKRATKRKQNKRSKKRTNKYTNRKKTRRSVNIFSKYLGGGGEIIENLQPVIENLQPVIEIKNNSLRRTKIADCYIFSKKWKFCEENVIYVVFQLNKTIGSSAFTAANSVRQGIVNAGVNFASGVSMFTGNGEIEAYDHKSTSYLLGEKLGFVLNNYRVFDGKQGDSWTGVGWRSKFTAETVYVRMHYSDDTKELQLYYTKAAFNPQNPTDWINEVLPYENTLEKKSVSEKAWEVFEKLLKDKTNTNPNRKEEMNDAEKKWESANSQRKRAENVAKEEDKKTYFHYTLNTIGSYDKDIKTAVDIVQSSQPAPTTDQPEQQAQIEEQQPAQTEEQQPAQIEEQQPAQTEQ